MASATLESNIWYSSTEGQSSQTIQVSLLPPPCDELTTKDPLRRATRVKPPRVTYELSPLNTNGRRSRWRGSTPSLHSVGAVESETMGCATKLRGSAKTNSVQRASSSGVATLPTMTP